MDQIFPPFADSGSGYANVSQVNCRWCGKLIADRAAIPVAYLPDRVRIAHELMENLGGPQLVCDECWTKVCGAYNTEEIAALLRVLSLHARWTETNIALLADVVSELRMQNQVLCDMKEKMMPLNRGTL